MSTRLFQRNGVWYTWAYDTGGRRVQRSTRCTDAVAAAEVAARLQRELQGVDGELVRVAAAPRSFVYLVRAGTEGPIKIGRAASPSFRVERLQTGTHETLTVLAIVPGGAILESAIHRFFAKDRLRGEWFKPSKLLLRFIEEIR